MLWGGGGVQVSGKVGREKKALRSWMGARALLEPDDGWRGERRENPSTRLSFNITCQGKNVGGETF